MPTTTSPDLNLVNALAPMLTLRLAILRAGRIVKELEFSTRSRRLIRIGRQPSAQVPLDDSSVALCHAVIELRDGKATLTDLGQTGGTSRNGDRITKARLKSHDQIQLGNTSLLVILEKPDLDERPDTRTRLFFKQLRLAPPEWIPELHRFLEYLTFRHRPSAGQPRLQPPPVRGRAKRVSVSEAFSSSESAAVPVQPVVSAPTPVVAPAIVSPPLALAAARQSETVASDGGAGFEPQRDFYDTRRLVSQMRRERRRFNSVAVGIAAALAIGMTVIVAVGRRDGPADEKPARASGVGAPASIPADDDDFVFRRLEAGGSLARVAAEPWAPLGYLEALGRHNQQLGRADHRLTSAAVIKLPRYIEYTVCRGDNLGAIAERLLGDRHQATLLYQVNRSRISDPARIEVGVALRIPVAVPARIEAPTAPAS